MTHDEVKALLKADPKLADAFHEQKEYHMLSNDNPDNPDKLVEITLTHSQRSYLLSVLRALADQGQLILDEDTAEVQMVDDLIEQITGGAARDEGVVEGE